MTAIPASIGFPGRHFLRLDEIAAALSCTRQHVLDLCREGKFGGRIRNFAKRPSQWLVPREAYERFVTANWSKGATA